MSNTYTGQIKLAKPASGDRTWNVPVNANCDTLDALNPVGDLAVTTHEQPSSSLLVDIAAGGFIDQSGTVQTYAGVSGQAIATGTTKTLYLDGTASWALVVSATSYPSTPHIRLATVVAGASTITSIADNRQCFPVAGSMAEGANLTLGTSTGTKIGTATTQKLGLWNATPIVQPSGALQAAVTDSTGSSATGTIPAIRNDTTAHCASDAADGLHVLYGLVNAMRTALVNSGIMKGSA
jgi:hypothetical protein